MRAIDAVVVAEKIVGCKHLFVRGSELVRVGLSGSHLVRSRRCPTIASSLATACFKDSLIYATSSCKPQQGESPATGARFKHFRGLVLPTFCVTRHLTAVRVTACDAKYAVTKHRSHYVHEMVVDYTDWHELGQIRNWLHRLMSQFAV